MSSEVISEPAGPRFGPYILTALLGRGGMGVVYKAYDTVKGRTVALKVLIPELAADRAFQDRFRRESKRVARLNEPHVIPIHDFGQIDGRLFIDMRLVEGTDLATILNRDGPLPPHAAAWIIAQVASALDAAHADGLIHRDIKPSNVLVTGHGQSMPFAYLIDFGIARLVNTSQSTGSGTIGTVAYMAPERITGAPGDRRTDVYSLACVLYECLTGRPPFVGEMVAVMWAQLNVPPPMPTTVRSGLPAAVDEVIARGLAKDPGSRYDAAGELAEAILAATADPGAVTVRPPADEEPEKPEQPEEPSEARSSGASSVEAGQARESDAPARPGVPLWESDPRGRAGTALRAIVSSPDLGIAALSSAQAMSAALKELLPDMPRETTVLVAAAEVGLAKALSYHVARGVELSAVRAAAVKSFANHTGFRPAACGWAVDELIAVLGLDSPSARMAR